MADLSQLTDEELEQKRQEILSKKARSMNVEEPRAIDLSPISDEELEAAKQGDRAAIEKIKAEIRSPISSAMKPITEPIGKFAAAAIEPIKRYGGENALRGALNTMWNPSIQDINDGDLIGAGGRSFVKNYGKSSLDVPSNEELLAGIPEGVPKQVAKIGVGEIAGAPTTAILQGAGSIAAKGASKVGTMLTGVPERITETYAKRGSSVKELIAKHGEDYASAADDVQSNILNALKSSKDEQNAIISRALENSPATPVMHYGDITEAMNKIKARYNPKAFPEVHADIDKLINRVRSVADDNGLLSVRDLQDVKRLLRQFTSYEPPGSAFNILSEAELAAKAGAAKAKRALDLFGPPEIKQANAALESIHGADDAVREFIKTGKPERLLVGIGSGTNPRLRGAFEDVSNIVGKNFLEDAENYAAYRQFQNAPLLPGGIEGTGKTATRLAVGGGVGGAIGGTIGGVVLGPAGIPIGTKVGAGIGMAATSPYALKKGIDLAAPAINLANKVPFKSGGGYAAYLAAKNAVSETPKQNNPQDVISKLSSNPGGMKYAAQLTKAAGESQQKFSVEYYMLHSNDPEFRKLVSEDENR